ncbi:fungal-specific transcription factor domain-containing protein [Hypoxylon fuscum]|nr:fungal-specific transcription factor domain-containing protein [Hypoxylon fuscum]
MTLREDMPTTPPTGQRLLPPANRRRDKPQLSCNLCRRRKVKCDRQQPCRTCTLRGLSTTCSYPPEGSRSSDRDPSTVSNRIRELEGLVHVLIQRAGPKTSSNATTSPHAHQALVHRTEDSPDSRAPGPVGPGEPAGCGTLTDTPAGVSYADGAHWSALLDSISELKECFPDAAGSGLSFPIPPVAPDHGPSPLLLYGRFTQIGKGEILSTVPPRPAVDRLLSIFFNSLDLAPAIIHSAQFIRQYEKFWEDPFAAPIIWVGQLYAMMCLATLLSMPHTGQDLSSMVPDAESAVLVRVYREKIVQCLTLGRYTRGGPYVLQTLIIYIATEHLLQEDVELGSHILLGMIMNIAMRMGYHRDPKNFSVISPFDGEMRRRTWAAIYQANLMFASQMGLPSMLKEHQIDTEEPHNLLDSDFDEDVTRLPPSRPESDLTPILYVIIRTRVASLWEKVRDIATDTRLHKYEEILMMDRKVNTDKRNIPPALKMQPIAQSITDPPTRIMQRIWLEICFLRLIIVLHKNYFMAANQYERYSYSRKVSLKAATQIIEYQHIVYESVKPDGLLYEARWKLSSVMNNEFLLATSILCAYMKQVSSTPECAVEGVSIEEISQLLATSSDCWQRFSAISRHARRAIEAIRLVLQATVTPTASPAGEDELNLMLTFQDPLLLDLNFPCTLEGFYNNDSTTSMSEPSFESAYSSEFPNVNRTDSGLQGTF